MKKRLNSAHSSVAKRSDLAFGRISSGIMHHEGEFRRHWDKRHELDPISDKKDNMMVAQHHLRELKILYTFSSSLAYFRKNLNL